MTYILEEKLNMVSRADAYRINVVGYIGDIYSITNKCSSSDHASEWIAKHSLTTKTTSQAQTIVDNAISTYNNNLPLIGSRNDDSLESITLE
jgi:hypothetical protein